MNNILKWEEKDALLNEFGWIVESELPFEIYHPETNSMATGIAAEYVCNELLYRKESL